MEYGSGCEDVSIPEMSVAEYVLQKAGTFGEKIAWVVDSTGQTVTYSEFVGLCRRVADNLYHLGLRKEDIVCILSKNCLEYIIMYHAVILRGGIIVSAGIHLTDYELGILLEDCKPKFMVTTPEHLSKVKGVCDEGRVFERVIAIGDNMDGYVPFIRLYDICPKAPPTKISPRKDVATMNYTSGTTGKSKGVMATHYNYMANICQFSHPDLSAFDVSKTNVTAIQRPLFHAYGQLIHCFFGMCAGVTQICTTSNDLKIMLEAICKYKITFLAVTPLAVKDIVDSPDLVAEYDISSLKSVFSAAYTMPEVTLQKFRQRFPEVDLRDTHGTTETQFSFFPKRGERIRSVGKPLPNMKAKIIDLDTLETLPRGEHGELCVQGPNVFKGYYNGSESDREAFKVPGWYRTGDVAYFDDEGNCHIVDRVKQMIKYVSSEVANEKMAPAEIEDVILMHDGVAVAAVVGKPDKDYGELPTAFIICKPGHSVNKEEIHKLVNDHLSSQKRLRGGIIFLSEMPLSGSGKVLRRLLRDKLIAELNDTDVKQ